MWLDQARMKGSCALTIVSRQATWTEMVGSGICINGLDKSTTWTPSSVVVWSRQSRLNLHGSSNYVCTYHVKVFLGAS